MTREYDAHSRPSTPEYRESYDRIFRRAKAARAQRAERRVQVERRHECICDTYGARNCEAIDHKGNRE